MAIGGLVLCAWFALVIMATEIPGPGAPPMHAVRRSTCQRAARAARSCWSHEHRARIGVRASQWEFEPLVVVPLAVTAILYAVGLARVWRRAGVGRGISGWSALSFAAGWLTLVAALVSPVAWLSQILFSVHMTQHTLLMLVAAPLLTFGHPLLAWMWALRDVIAGGDRARRSRARASCGHGARVTAPAVGIPAAGDRLVGLAHPVVVRSRAAQRRSACVGAL